MNKNMGMDKNQEHEHEHDKDMGTWMRTWKHERGNGNMN
jgi:hypothetical protein